MSKLGRKTVLGGLLVFVLVATFLIGCGQGETSGEKTTVTKTVTATAGATGTGSGRITTLDEMPDDPATVFPSTAGKKVVWIWTIQQHPIVATISRLVDDLNNRVYHFKLTNLDSEHDAEKANALMQSAIASQPDLIVTQPVDALSHQKYVLEAQAHGIPVIGSLEMALGADYNISGNPYGMGVVATEYLAKRLDYKGDVGVMMGDFTSYYGRNRLNAFRDVIAKYPDMNILFEVDTPTGQWMKNGGYDAMKMVLTAHPHIDGLYNGTDPSTAGCVQAIKEAKRMGEMVIVSNDMDKDGIAMVKNGEIDATVYMASLYFGRGALINAQRILSTPGYVAGSLRGGEIAPIKVITKETLNELEPFEGVTFEHYWDRYWQ